mgnify:CR=1 FL=1
MANHIRQFENDEPVFIQPIPNGMTIVHGPALAAVGEIVMVQSPDWRYTADVLEFVKAQVGGDWVMSLWKLTWYNKVTHANFIQGNPHQNTDGLWMYLLQKEEK